MEARLWTIPAQRMKKAGREHRVPLRARAIAIVQELRPLARGDASLIFPGTKDKLLSDMTLTATLRRMSAGCTAHEFRSSFRDWAGNETHVQREVALAHVIGDKAEQAYRRSDALAKREGLMDAWASYLEGAPANVVMLRSA